MLYQFPGPFIFSKEISDHQQIKDKYLPKIVDDIEANKEKYIIPGWNCEVYSTMLNQVDFLFDDDLVNKVIWEPLDECLEQTKLSKVPKSSNIHQLWYNYYDEGFFQEAHTHGNSSFSGIYLLKLEEENTTSFVNNTSHEYFDVTYTTKHFKEGTVIIFPSRLLHYVNPVKKNRITISFNIHTIF